ncbi:helix-turn-helix domain-containing protein [Leisingera aquimarina]|uniref:helix-turn-helix domain-containing protein n=2 Tax=Leisingera TaxID=191028 RepID=UPI000A056547|nr:helix-turn-helix transcriptional regulator [Leisingera aquimarina]
MTSRSRSFQKSFGEIAAIASSSMPRDTQTQEIVASLSREIPVVAVNFLIASHDNSLQSRFSSGYSQQMVAHLETNSYQRELSALGLFSLTGSLRYNDVRWDEKPGLKVLSDCIRGEGHGDCVTTPLVSSSGRLVGFQNLSLAEAGLIDNDVRSFLDDISTTVANLLDPVSFRNLVSQDYSEPQSVFAIDHTGAVLTLRGTEAGWRDKNGFLKTARAKAGAGASNWIVRCRDGLHSFRLWNAGVQQLGKDGNHLIVCDLGVVSLPLTLRELEVASLVAEGYRSIDIAQQLKITRRTANAHVEAILQKLDVSNRAAAAAVIVHHGWRLLC